MTTSREFPRPYVLHPHDPSELLAEATLLSGQEQSHRVILLGLDHGRRVGPVLSMALTDLAGCDPLVHLDMQFDILRSYGASGASVLVVCELSEEPEHPTDSVMSEVENLERDAWSPGIPDYGVTLAAMILHAASNVADGRFVVEDVCVIDGGRTRCVRLGEQCASDPDSSIKLLISPPTSIVSLRETATGSKAVVAGVPLPLPEAVKKRRVLDFFASTPVCFPLPTRPEQRAHDLHDIDHHRLLDRWSAVVHDLAVMRHGQILSGECVPHEPLMWPRIYSFLEDFAEVPVFEAVLALHFRHGNVALDPIEESIPKIVEHPWARPHSDTCGGGAWYEAVLDLICIADLGERDLLPFFEYALWQKIGVNARILLALMQWWNHRFASAAEYATQALVREPQRVFAQCALELATRPVFPAWDPTHTFFSGEMRTSA